MTILIDNRLSQYKVEKDMEHFIKNIVKEVLKQENCTDNYEISISLVSNEEIKDLNKEYRNIDSATDVLSFPMINFKNPKEDHWQIEGFDEELPLGDIVISIEKAKEQSQEFGHSFKRELAFLLAHGMLHLLGYDHEDKNQETIMFQKQEEILDKLHIRR